MYLWKESTAAWVPLGSCAILAAICLAASCTYIPPGQLSAGHPVFSQSPMHMQRLD